MSQLSTDNFYAHLGNLCDTKSRFYSSFHLQREARQAFHSVNPSVSFLPFVKERDKLGRLLRNV